MWSVEDWGQFHPRRHVLWVSLSQPACAGLANMAPSCLFASYQLIYHKKLLSAFKSFHGILLRLSSYCEVCNCFHLVLKERAPTVEWWINENQVLILDLHLELTMPNMKSMKSWHTCYVICIDHLLILQMVPCMHALEHMFGHLLSFGGIWRGFGNTFSHCANWN